MALLELRDVQAGYGSIQILHGVSLHVSAGIVSAVRITVSTEIEPLIEQARDAMMQSKREGGEQIYTVFV